MNRRKFIEWSVAGGILSAVPVTLTTACLHSTIDRRTKELAADVIIAGGGVGGCAAALSALRNGLSVIMTEETDWIGGQLTQQGVPPDEHAWIETHGATQAYRDFRTAVRNYYFRHYPLTNEARARQQLNPGDGSVSRLCHEPRVALAVLNELFSPYLSMGRLVLLTEHKVVSAETDGDKVLAIKIIHIHTKHELILTAPYFVDATELGELLPLTGTEFVRGTESMEETGEWHAARKADPDNQQACTVCFAMDHEEGANHLIDKPETYDFWYDYIPALTPAWPGRLLDLTYSNPSTLTPLKLGFHPSGVALDDVLNLWNYRRIINKNNFKPGLYTGDITIVNWPMNDYLLGNLDTDFERNIFNAKQLSLSLFYWLQTECPRPDGKLGWPGLRLRGDVMGTEDGMAKYPYIRESRRIRAIFTVTEEHIGMEQRLEMSGKETAADMFDSIGVGYYRIDLHPSTKGDNYIDIASLPFQIPLGALISQRMENLLPACKNIGTTHITNGCYRLHPVEWNIGESVGSLVNYALHNKTTPRFIREKSALLADFQRTIRAQGIETHWPVK
jgi:hypothetical protein